MDLQGDGAVSERSGAIAGSADDRLVVVDVPVTRARDRISPG